MNTQYKEPRLQDLADRLFAEHGHGPQLLQHLKREILRDPALIAQAIHIAIRTCVRNTRMDLRAGIKDALQQEGQRFLFGDWPLEDWTPLAKATKERLLEEADRYKVRAEGNARSERFLRKLASHLKEGEAVHQLYGEDDLRRCWEECGQPAGRGCPAIGSIRHERER